MKKMILILSLLCAVSTANPAWAMDESKCTNAGGTILTGNDKKSKYCVSPFSMNWWTAFSWCQSVGGALVDYTTECFKHNNNYQCPNINTLGIYVWTRNAASSTEAWLIIGLGLAINPRERLHSALCQ